VLEPIQLYNPVAKQTEAVKFHLRTVEEDGQAVPKVTEHMGTAARKNCNKCLLTSEVNPDTNAGAYLGGYISGDAFTAQRKTDQSAREFSLQVAAGERDRSEYGIGPPSIFTTMFPAFNVIQGHPIEMFHKLLLVLDSLSRLHQFLPPVLSSFPFLSCYFLFSFFLFLLPSS